MALLFATLRVHVLVANPHGLSASSPFWSVRPVEFDTMKRTLVAWRDGYQHDSDDFNSTLEMIAWHKATTDVSSCLGLHYDRDLRALAQIRITRPLQSAPPRLYLRSIMTACGEDVAGTILMYKLLSQDVSPDWEDLRKYNRWYLAALFTAVTAT